MPNDSGGRRATRDANAYADQPYAWDVLAECEKVGSKSTHDIDVLKVLHGEAG